MRNLQGNLAFLCLAILAFWTFGFALPTTQAAIPTTAPTTIDQSSPKAAMHSFWAAIDQGDAEAAKQVCVAGESQSNWVDGFATMCDGWRKMNDARVRRFGQTGPDHHTPGYTAVALADKFTAQQQGDTATLILAGHPNQGTIAVRKDGKWYLDLNRSLGGDIAATTVRHQAIASAAREIAANIDAGQYAADADVETAFRAALAKASSPQVHANPASSQP